LQQYNANSYTKQVVNKTKSYNLDEENIKHNLNRYLKDNGWETKVASDAG
jgi:hypothetical protein